MVLLPRHIRLQLSVVGLKEGIGTVENLQTATKLTMEINVIVLKRDEEIASISGL